MAAELPDSLLRFLHACVPTYQAAEVLLFFAAHPEAAFRPEEVVVAMRPLVVTVPAVKEYAAVFVAHGLLLEVDETYRYGPRSPELERAIGELAHAYSERPVTLVAAIYKIADSRLKSFADSFKLRKD